MINITVGTVRKLVERRKEILAAVKTITKSDNFLVLTLSDNHKFNMTGYVNNDSSSLYMLGHGIASTAFNAKISNPHYNEHEYLNQPMIVAQSLLGQANTDLQVQEHAN